MKVTISKIFLEMAKLQPLISVKPVTEPKNDLHTKPFMMGDNYYNTRTVYYLGYKHYFHFQPNGSWIFTGDGWSIIAFEQRTDQKQTKLCYHVLVGEKIVNSCYEDSGFYGALYHGLKYIYDTKQIDQHYGDLFAIDQAKKVKEKEERAAQEKLGGDLPSTPGYIYCPYIPMIVSPTIFAKEELFFPNKRKNC